MGTAVYSATGRQAFMGIKVTAVRSLADGPFYQVNLHLLFLEGFDTVQFMDVLAGKVNLPAG